MTSDYGSTSGTPEREARPLMDSLLVFSLHDEIAQLRSESQWAEHEANARTLAKSADFRVLLAVLHAEAKMVENDGEARASIQIIDGSAVLTLGDDTRPLSAGHIAVVDAGNAWTVRATTDCALLLTLAWPVAGAATSAP